ncbi:hypothetical protein [Ruegeria arenilitoris]|uniref:hypothetical protein n=1 Tax=Ruegeria arenilitoris TaxID=1173585 RepID=UPI0014808B5C|nr:hypothetical protein [Ruegeria arenilitoris]
MLLALEIDDKLECQFLRTNEQGKKMSLSTDQLALIEQEGRRAARDYRDGDAPECPYDELDQRQETDAWNEGYQREMATMYGDPD